MDWIRGGADEPRTWQAQLTSLVPPVAGALLPGQMRFIVRSHDCGEWS
jgi:hypothetical protein